MMKGKLPMDIDPMYAAAKKTGVPWDVLDRSQQKELPCNVVSIYEHERKPVPDGPVEGPCRAWHKKEIKQYRDAGGQECMI